MPSLLQRTCARTVNREDVCDSEDDDDGLGIEYLLFHTLFLPPL